MRLKRLDNLVKPAGSLEVWRRLFVGLQASGKGYPSIDKKNSRKCVPITGWWKRGYFLRKRLLHILQAAFKGITTVTPLQDMQEQYNVVDIGVDGDLVESLLTQSGNLEHSKGSRNDKEEAIVR